MMIRSLSLVLVLVFFFQVRGEALGYLSVAKGSVDLKSERLVIRVKNQVAQMELEQLFLNKSGGVLEGSYELPLNEESVVYEFAQYIDGKKVVAAVMDLENARQVFDDQRRQGNSASLGERASANLFKMAFTPFKPGEERRISVRMTEILPYDAGAILLRLRTGAANQFSGAVEKLSLVIDWEENKKIVKSFSPSHKFEIKPRGETGTTLMLEEKNFKTDRDILVYSLVESEETGAAFCNYRDPVEKEGYFLFSLVPPEKNADEKVLARSISFVFDTSGSMRGEKIDQARAALRFCVENLNPGDFFRLITFSSNVEELSAEFLPATPENREKAVAFVDKLRAAGSTNIEESMKTALSKDPSGRPGVVIFMTDGRPTVGQTAIGPLLKSISSANQHHMKVFTFGVGADLSRQLLNRMARDSAGTADYVRPGDNLEDKISLFYEKTKKPIWTDLKLEFSGGARVVQRLPSQAPDLCRGSRLLILGKYEGDGDIRILLTGQSASGEVRKDWEFPLVADSRDSFIPRLWAARRIEDLEEAIDRNGPNGELVNEIKALGKKHNLATRFTSFVATRDPAPTNNNVLSSLSGSTLTRKAQALAPSAAPERKMDRSDFDGGRAKKSKEFSLGDASAPGASFEDSMDRSQAKGGAALKMAPIVSRQGFAQSESVKPEKESFDFAEKSAPRDRVLCFVQTGRGKGLVVIENGRVALLFAGQTFAGRALSVEGLESALAEKNLFGVACPGDLFEATTETKLWRIFESGGSFHALLSFDGTFHLVSDPRVIGGRYRIMNVDRSSVQFTDIKSGEFRSLSL